MSAPFAEDQARVPPELARGWARRLIVTACGRPGHPFGHSPILDCMISQPVMTPAPLDPAALADSLRPFGESQMLPWVAYVDPAVFEWEQRHFGGGWLCVGRSRSGTPAPRPPSADLGAFLPPRPRSVGAVRCGA
jgi:hypothetical protein